RRLSRGASSACLAANGRRTRSRSARSTWSVPGARMPRPTSAVVWTRRDPDDLEEVAMSIKTVLFSLSCVVALVAPAAAQQDKLGKVIFPTSCDAKVQAQFERGVAMLHSYWFTEARKVFDAVIAQDSSCAMAYWGLAVNYLGNSL